MDPVQALSALGSVALILGNVVALAQVRMLNRQRQNEIVMRLYAPLYGVELTRAFRYVQGLPLTDYGAFAAQATLDEWVALDQVCSFFEAMGPLLHRRIARIGLLDELMTSSAFAAWNECVPFVQGNRRATGPAQNYQWFEYLVHELDRHH